MISGKTLSSYAIALVGQGRVKRFDSMSGTNVIASPLARTSTIVTLYNRHTKKGAILHFDRVSFHYIHKTLKNIKRRLLSTQAKPLDVTLFGGVEFSVYGSISRAVKQQLRRLHMTYTHDVGAWVDCQCRTYSVILDLDSGKTIVDNRTSMGNQMVNSVDFTAFDKRTKREQLDLSVKCEGVSTVQGREISRQVFCDKAQGYPLWIRDLG